MSATKLLQNRIKELERDLIPNATDPRDILHNEGIREYIEIYQGILTKPLKEDTTCHDQATAPIQSTQN